MRIFINMPDESGSNKTTRLSLTNCTDTTQFIRQVCKELNLNKHGTILSLKNEIINLRIIEGWPLSCYGIKNGSWIFVQENLNFHKQLSQSSSATLQKIQQSLQDLEEDKQKQDKQSNKSFNSEQKATSFFSDPSIVQQDFNDYFDKQLEKMLQYARKQKLSQISNLLKEQPDIQDPKLKQEILDKKNNYILNEIGQCGRNVLHWAIHNQNFQMVSFLLLKHCNPSVLTIDDYTPLQLAIVHRNIDISKLLLAQPKVDPNKVTTHGTALHLAAYHHNTQLVKTLLENGANPDQVDKNDKKAIQISDVKQIKKLFQDNQKRASLRHLKPNISKGNTLKIASVTFRSKKRILQINPFKNEVILYKQNNQIDMKFRLDVIKLVQKVGQKKWLMDQKLNYLKIQYKANGEENKLLLGFQKVQICNKWISAFSMAIHYAKNLQFVTKIEPHLQLIEIFDDTKNQIKVHKRQVQSKNVQASNLHRYSIFDMNITQDKEQIRKIEPKKEEKSFQTKVIVERPVSIKQQSQMGFQSQFKNSFGSSNHSDKDLRDSQIMLGSIINQKNLNSPSLSYRNTVSTLPNQNNFNSNELLSSNSQTNKSSQQSPSFRKKSMDLSSITQFKLQEKKKIVYSDFDFIKQLGSGAFGQVYLTKAKRSKKQYAMKVLNKKKLMAKKQLKYAVSETNILKKVNHPFIIGLHYCFQTPTNLYMALDYCPYGDLSELLCQKQRISESTSKFIIAQLILAIEYLHQNKILYRDLKPQNILISQDGFLKLIDFGLSKQNNFATSFCGSPAYLSPQMLQKKGHSFSTDIYGIGCVLYQLVVGQPPYFDENIDQLFQNIKTARLKFPGYLTKEIKSLISKMLDRDIKKRIGVADMKQIKTHEFFNGFSWDKLLNKKITVPKQIFPDQIQNQYFHLDNKMEQNKIKYMDQDYTENSLMINRIKGFSFQRDQQNTAKNK